MKVSALKRAIKNQTDGLITAPWPGVQLFLAKTTSNAWLNEDETADVILNELGQPQGFRMMKSSLFLRNPYHFGENFQLREGQIHVLVMVPPESAEDKSVVGDEVVVKIEQVHEEGPQNELDYYRQCGARIHEKYGKYYRPVLDKIDAIYDSTDLPLPFICVEGSSGMGKTQLAFALQGRRPWFYWLATSVTPDSQAVYQNFGPISKAFKKVVGKDDPVRTEKKENILNCRSDIYSTDNLWTCGFISLLLEYSTLDAHQSPQTILFEEETVFRVTRCSVYDVRRQVAEIERKGKLLPFFILDEMTPNVNQDAGAMNMAAFQRNIFRACGLVVIVMGTDSTISNLIHQPTGSVKMKIMWVSIAANFPPFEIVFGSENQQDQKVWETVVARFPVVKYIAMNSRGRFARCFVNEVIKVLNSGNNFLSLTLSRIELWNLLDKAFAGVSSITQTNKRFMETKNGKYAQLRRFLSRALETMMRNRRQKDKEPTIVRLQIPAK